MSNPFGYPVSGSGESPGESHPSPAGAGSNPFAPEPRTESPERPPANRFELRWLLVVVVVVVVAGLGVWAIFGLGESGERNQSSSTASSVAPAPPRESPSQRTDAKIAELLNEIVLVEELPQLPGYERSCSPGKDCVFGPAWTDTEHTGCDTRNRVLAQQLVRVVFKPGTHDCKVLTGLLHDPYTGDDVEFGPGHGGDIQIDHVFALARAWDAGAATWPRERRVGFANDTGNLLAVSAKENMSKSDSGPDTWMPPNAEFGCEYAQIYLTIAAKYSLMITRDDAASATQACKA